MVTRNRIERLWILKRKEIRIYKYTYAYLKAFQISALTLIFKAKIFNYWYAMSGHLIEELDVTASQQYLWVPF